MSPDRTKNIPTVMKNIDSSKIDQSIIATINNIKIIWTKTHGNTLGTIHFQTPRAAAVS